MTDCEIDNNDTKLMQLSNDLNSYCVNESINSDNTDLVDLNNKCLIREKQTKFEQVKINDLYL